MRTIIKKCFWALQWIDRENCKAWKKFFETEPQKELKVIGVGKLFRVKDKSYEYYQP